MVWYGMILLSSLPWHGLLFSCLLFLSLFYQVPYSSCFFPGPILTCWQWLCYAGAAAVFFFFALASPFSTSSSSSPSSSSSSSSSSHSSSCCLSPAPALAFWVLVMHLCVLMRLLPGWPCVLAEVAGFLSLLALFACLRACFAFLALLSCRACFAFPALPCQACK